MKALLVTKEYRRPIGIIDIGPQVQSYFKGMQLMEIYTYEPPSVRFAQLSDTDPMPAMSKVHFLEATYMHGLGPDPLLTIHALNQNTENLLVDYFGAFSGGNHDAILEIAGSSPVVSILGYLRR